jgi:hypothetical protein
MNSKFHQPQYGSIIAFWPHPPLSSAIAFLPGHPRNWIYCLTQFSWSYTQFSAIRMSFSHLEIYLFFVVQLKHNLPIVEIIKKQNEL